MKLNFENYKDKVRACWIGKNIGGTMGGPYESVRHTLDVKGFKTAPQEVLPNDDLDLQLVWLHAVEHEGAKNITSEVLGEYWLSFITPYWNEYGISKRNMERGVLPPVAGEINEWKHSNGAWIRTEIWATLCPACPDLAVRYALEDAKVDHGTGEGTYAAMFLAAIESAAFVLSDVRKLIEIGLAKIPETSRTAQSIRLLLQAYDAGEEWQKAREIIFEANKDIGDGWFEAPSNVAYAILGILYGAGDFKKSMLTAINCGDDTDCTAATVGSILGIVYGTKGIPEDWARYVGDSIVTCSINQGISWPKISTCSQLTEKVVTLAPAVLAQNNAKITLFAEKQEASEEEIEHFLAPYGTGEETDEMRASVLSSKPDTITHKFAYATAFITYKNGVNVVSGDVKTLGIQLLNNVKAYGNQPYTVHIRLYLPEGFTADCTDFDICLPHWTPKTKDCISEEKIVSITAGENVSAVNRVVIEMRAEGRYTTAFVPVTFLSR